MTDENRPTRGIGADHPGTVASGVESPSPDDTALLLDVMLGKLATYLRMCGYDTAYAMDGDGGDPGDEALLHRVSEEHRVLLTRDISLAEQAPRSVLVAGRTPLDQLRELESVGFIISLGEFPARCSACNGVIDVLEDGDSVPEYAPELSETTLWRCRDCGQVYWRGSHWRDVESRLNES
ncbi:MULTISPECIES: Mut7-C RNAse domain-containing protein [Haloferax]|nr:MULTISPECIES: Mut7-C RNAse domain-containing protein [Haloferax]